MSIFAYTGLPGSGKSYNVVAHVILPALQKGRRVVTNIPLNRDAIRKVTPKGEIVEFPMDAIATNPDAIEDYCTNGSVVVLDEVWRLFPAGMKTHQVPETFKSLLAEHRHRANAAGDSMQIVLVTQDTAQIANFARVLVEITFHHNKLTAVGASNRFRVSSYRGCVSGAQPPESRLIRSTLGRYRPEIYGLYQSQTMSDATGHANEKTVDQRATIWRRPMVWVGAAFVGIAPIWAVSALYSVFSGEQQPAAVVPAASVASQGTRPAEPVSTMKALAGVESSPGPSIPAKVAPERKPAPPSYRLAGFAHGADGEGGFAMVENGGKFARVPWSECWEAGDGLTRCAFGGYIVTEFGVEN